MIEAFEIAKRYNKPVMVKSQVHVGGRGKAGGIKYAENAEAAKVLATQILGMNIKGLVVKKVLVTVAEDIISESYVGIILDRSSKRPVIMVSPPPTVQAPTTRNRNISSTAIIESAATGLRVFLNNSIRLSIGFYGHAMNSVLKYHEQWPCHQYIDVLIQCVDWIFKMRSH